MVVENMSVPVSCLFLLLWADYFNLSVDHFQLLGSFILLKELLSRSFRNAVSIGSVVAQVVNNRGLVLRLMYFIQKIHFIKADMKDYLSTAIQQVPDGEEIILRNIVCNTPLGLNLNHPGITAKIQLGERLLVTGPSGKGTTTLLRVLLGLWPMKSGKLLIPEKLKLVCLPQKPYMYVGTLREQLLYPFISDANENTVDIDLKRYLTMMKLDYLLQRFTLDSTEMWHYILSPGEQQKLSFLRLFQHIDNKRSIIHKHKALSRKPSEDAIVKEPSRLKIKKNSRRHAKEDTDYEFEFEFQYKTQVAALLDNAHESIDDQCQTIIYVLLLQRGLTVVTFAPDGVQIGVGIENQETFEKDSESEENKTEENEIGHLRKYHDMIIKLDGKGGHTVARKLKIESVSEEDDIAF
eukprot:TRINITY_DN9768_c0_g2_i1.p1 TRINITY_DN9768_c0_g2~~TRINITY_DN9768_c0_g2_i1.p1  ORF type:complete len:408 (-),score=102.50 TRINITY_DN9768_c0_g2_i1:12-1235(-)